MLKKLVLVGIAALGLTIGSAGVASAHPVNPGDRPILVLPGFCLIGGSVHDAQGNEYPFVFCNNTSHLVVVFGGTHAAAE